MKYVPFILRFVLLSTVVLGFGGSIRGQQTGERRGVTYIVVPTENVLLVVASQPGCTLQIENLKLLTGIEGRPLALNAEIRNRGIKPIRSFNYALLSSLGGGWVDSWPRKVMTELLAAGQVLPLTAEPADEIISLTDELRQKLKLHGPMRAILIFVVVRVEFADGTTYSEESTFKAVKNYLDDMANQSSRSK